MELIFKNRNGSKVSQRQREHIEEKLGKLARYMDLSSMTVEVTQEQRQNQGEAYCVQVTLVGQHGVILRGEQKAVDLYTATDMVQEVLQRQIKRFKEKHWRRGRLRRKGDEFVVPELEPATEVDAAMLTETGEERRILRVKEFALKPMFSDEAVEQMELLDHNFFVFRDADSSKVSIVYRRKDGNYGLIVPDET